jgi:hypothetical protein
MGKSSPIRIYNVSMVVDLSDSKQKALAVSGWGFLFALFLSDRVEIGLVASNARDA